MYRNLQYFVPVPGKNKKDESGKLLRLELLKSISGAAVPGQLTALMGGSGAGKVTLFSCLYLIFNVLGQRYYLCLIFRLWILDIGPSCFSRSVVSRLFWVTITGLCSPCQRSSNACVCAKGGWALMTFVGVPDRSCKADAACVGVSRMLRRLQLEVY